MFLSLSPIFQNEYTEYYNITAQKNVYNFKYDYFWRTTWGLNFAFLLFFQYFSIYSLSFKFLSLPFIVQMNIRNITVQKKSMLFQITKPLLNFTSTLLLKTITVEAQANNQARSIYYPFQTNYFPR